MIGVPLDDLLYQVRMGGLQVRAGGLVELKLKAPPQLGHVEGLVPAAADLRGEGAVQERQELEDVEQDLLRQASPVGRQISRVLCGLSDPLAGVRRPLTGWGTVLTFSAQPPFHSRGPERAEKHKRYKTGLVQTNTVTVTDANMQRHIWTHAT